MSDNLSSLVKALHSGDLSRLPELGAALKAYPPEAVWSALQAQGLQITGDGNIVGSGNVAIVVKGESPELATQLAELAERVRDAEQAGRAAILYGQAASALERGRLRQAFAALTELRTVDAHYPGADELFVRARRAHARHWLRMGILATLGALALFGLLYSSFRKAPPPACDFDRPTGSEGAVLAMAFEAREGRDILWMGRSEKGVEIKSGMVPLIPALRNSTVLSLAMDNQSHHVWVGMSGGGLAIWSGQKADEPWLLRTRADGLPGCQISVILLDGERAYVGTYDGRGLGVTTDFGEHWYALPPPAGWRQEALFVVHALAADLDGSVWAGTIYGLYQLKDEKWESPSYPSWFQSGKNLPQVTAISVDQDGIKWIGTRYGNGLALLDSRPGNEAWVGPITSRTGLASDNITVIAVLPDGKSALVGTEKGLSICRKKKDVSGWVVDCEVVDHPDLRDKEVRSLVIAPDGLAVHVGTDASQPLDIDPTQWWANTP